MKTKFTDLITSVDVLNTLKGGISEPFLSIVELADGRELRIRVPGVEKDAMHIEINNSDLSVFYFIPIQSNGQMIHMPQVVYNHKIPHFVEPGSIKATVEGDELVVRMPFNKLRGNRKIEIGKE